MDPAALSEMNQAPGKHVRERLKGLVVLNDTMAKEKVEILKLDQSSQRHR